MPVAADSVLSDDGSVQASSTPNDPWDGGERGGRPPVILTIAGSDPSGGAGIQADLKTFSALGAYGTAVITALTAQSTQGVTGVHTVPSEFVRAQLDTLVADVRVDAIKIGMLANAATVRAVADFLREFTSEGGPVVVLDPVMVSTSGSRLLADDAVAAMRDLLPLASVITPNIPEAAVLLEQREATDLAEMREQGGNLLRLGARRVLLKGGHLTGEDATDLWLDAVNEHLFTEPRVSTINTHGTGCSLSSAMAALAVRGGSWTSTVSQAKRWLTGALRAADSLEIGHGPGPVHHFYELWANSVPGYTVHSGRRLPSTSVSTVSSAELTR
jgi:hydroxymethylpyrimidine/phosphomethylpyrimidine kinase